MRPALPIVLLLAFTAPLCAQLPSEGRTSYSRDDRIRIPFELRTNDRATKVVLYYSFDGGAWEEHETVRAGGRREFIFRATREGAYSFATMTYFSDGASDPPRKDQLTEQRRVVIDKTPPKVVLRPSMAADGAPGVEWDATDDNMDPRGIRLEFRWPEMSRWEPIDRNVPFGPRDSRHWQLKATDRMQVRLIATDRAGNRITSDAVWVSSKDAERAGEYVPKSPAIGASSPRDRELTPAAGTRVVQPSLHYVNNRTVKLNVNATVGPSGLTKAYLYVADDKLDWKKEDEKGPQPAPAVSAPDKPRVIPLDFTFKTDHDGLYNFIIVLEGHRGRNRPIPRRGDVGDVQVMIDATPPTVEIEGNPHVTSNGDRGAVVNIRWKAADANIAPVPIKLEYCAVKSDRPGELGEWKAITPDWIDNTGQHTWAAPTGEAYEFKIRVTCKDRAGNENKAETVKPVNTDLQVPGVEGVDVAPGSGGVGTRPAPGAGSGSIPSVSDIHIGPAPKGR